ncbi:MAG: hypothetical protein P8Y28_14335 [Gammaproteobacteria bacterium]|jgi:hypothetical protein
MHTTIKLSKTLDAWETAGFNDVAKAEIEQLDATVLPLQQALLQGNYTNDNNFSVMILSSIDEPSVIRVKTGIFYKGMITGCSCADDPTPIDEHPEYCELLFDINKETAETAVTLLPQ